MNGKKRAREIEKQKKRIVSTSKTTDQSCWERHEKVRVTELDGVEKKT